MQFEQRHAQTPPEPTRKVPELQNSTSQLLVLSPITTTFRIQKPISPITEYSLWNTKHIYLNL